MDDFIDYGSILFDHTVVLIKEGFVLVLQCFYNALYSTTKSKNASINYCSANMVKIRKLAILKKIL